MHKRFIRYDKKVAYIILYTLIHFLSLLFSISYSHTHYLLLFLLQTLSQWSLESNNPLYSYLRKLICFSLSLFQFLPLSPPLKRIVV